MVDFYLMHLKVTNHKTIQEQVVNKTNAFLPLLRQIYLFLLTFFFGLRRKLICRPRRLVGLRHILLFSFLKMFA